MAETVGALILSATGLAEVTGIAGFALGSTTVAGIGISTIVGTAAIVGVSIGLSYATNRPTVPKPEDGSQPLKQSIPPRIMGYGQNRLAGFYMVFEARSGSSYDLMAFHHGRIEAIDQVYLHDDEVSTSPVIRFGGLAHVTASYSDGRYTGDQILVEAALGAPGQTASQILLGNPAISDIWSSAHVGNGIAWVAMKCAGQPDVPEFTKIFPHQLPLLSVIARCTPVWDPRIAGQDRTNPLTWASSSNPVIQLIDYLTREDGGLALDYDTLIAPNIDAWMVEADLCDELVARPDGAERRYVSNGWFYFDNKPEDIINAILATCDGWLSESGDGTLTITVGVYREPDDPPLTGDHIKGFSVNFGQADEQAVNQLNISFTDRANKYVSAQTDPWRDEDAIALYGVRAQELELKWVQSPHQARRLAGRAMDRLSALADGTLTTTLYGLRYLGKRWVKVQYPFVSGLQDCVVEIQGAEVDLLAGRIVWQYLRVAPDFIAPYVPVNDPSGVPEVVPELRLTWLREDGSSYLREDGESYIRENS